jgi:hypothetical protein
MVTVNPQELRQRAGYFRSISLDGEDLRLKVALTQLADDFDREAAEIEARSSDVAPQIFKSG